MYYFIFRVIVSVLILGRLKETIGSYGAVPYLSGGALILSAIFMMLGKLFWYFQNRHQRKHIAN